jgi:hypothetical protein
MTEKPQPWKYTDDIIAGAALGSFIISWFLGNPLPEYTALLPLGYAFGKEVEKWKSK